MSKPREPWWGYVKNVLRAYPDYKRELARLRSSVAITPRYYANARLYRQGQQLPVISHLLVVKDGMDEAVVSALHSKGDMQEALMQALKAKITKAKEGKA